MKILFPLLKIFILVIFGFTLLSSCGSVDKIKNIRKPVDLRTDPLDPDEKAKRNIAEGRGITLGKLGGGNTNYEFSTSNPMWRATLDSLDFLPLVTVDYSGGLIISDWYSDGKTQNESIKIIVRFLSNEIMTNSLKIQVFQKVCTNQTTCTTRLIKSSISEELTRTILSKAAVIDKNKNQKK